MIILFHGDDLVTSRNKFRTFVDGLMKKHTEASWFSFSAENFDQAAFAETIVGGTLFYKKHLVLCDNLGANKEVAPQIVDKIKDLAESENVFIFLENNTEKKYLDKLIKHSAQIKEYNLREEVDEKLLKKELDKKLFAVGDGIIARENKTAWLSYERARAAGYEPENIFWTIARTVKNLLLVKTSTNPAELGLHPYVLGKTKTGAAKYTTEELQQLFSRLSALWHDNFFSTDEFAAGLERLILGI